MKFGIGELRAFAEDRELRAFLEKSFSIEMFLIMIERENVVGIEYLYDEIRSPKPQRASFYRYVNRLVSLRVVNVEEDECKKSRKILSLEPNLFHKIEGYRPDFVNLLGRG